MVEKTIEMNLLYRGVDLDMRLAYSGHTSS